jgi:uncharacterized protein (TIGR03437 family)
MKYCLKILVVLSIFVLATHSTESYVRSPVSSTGVPIAWNIGNPDTPIVSNGRIVYRLNSAGSDDIPFTEVERVMAASFQTWEDIPTSFIAFQRGPDTSSTASTSDGIYQIYWLENSTTTSDGLNLAGAFAVSRLTTYTNGPRAGEITDASLIFNGNQFRWATDGRGDAADLQEVATHEIGHGIGISHSPIGGATMFPRTGPGRVQGRTLASDDQIAASIAYPSPGFLSSTGTIRGSVRDNNGAPIFGAHVAAVNANGVVVSGILSQPDGSYAIQGLPPGGYTVYAEPLDPVSSSFFSRSDLTSFYSGVNTDFQTSGDLPVNLGAGSTATLDIGVTRGNPALDAYFVAEPTGQSFFNVSTTLAQGQSNVTVGVTGPGLPLSGNPLSISGPGFTIIRTYFRTSTSGQPAILADLNVSPTAAVGAHNLIINNGSQRTIVSGGVDIIGGNGAPSSVATVSAANFANGVAAESIAAAFGQNLATTTTSASGGSLPTSLGGTSVRLRDAAGNERMAPLFFVSPTQLNYQIAPGITIGQTSVTITNGNGEVSSGSVLVDPVAPGLFTADATGKGLAAALVFRIRSNGSQVFEQVARFDSGLNTFVAIPIDLGPTTDQVFLVLFGTGIRFRSSLPSVNIGGVNAQVTFAGPQGSFTGLDQVNARLDRSLIGRGAVNVTMVADGRTANAVSVSVR